MTVSPGGEAPYRTATGRLMEIKRMKRYDKCEAKLMQYYHFLKQFKPGREAPYIQPNRSRMQTLHILQNYTFKTFSNFFLKIPIMVFQNMLPKT